jgi:hypothetical protein
MTQKKKKLTVFKAMFASLAILGTVLVAAPSFAATCNGTSTYFDWDCKKGNGIESLILTIYNFISAGVGLALVIGIVLAGVRYSLATGDKAKMEAAIGMLRSCAIAFVLYAAMWVILNLLIPGGVLSGLIGDARNAP